MDPSDQFRSSSNRSSPFPTNGGLLESVESTIFPISPLRISDGSERSIEFRRKAESWFSFPYHTLISCEYHPHSCIDITFATHRIEITGRNLQSLYREIRHQSLGAIEEGLRSDQFSIDDSAAVVVSIQVSELDPPR